MTLEQYLRANLEHGVIDHSIRARLAPSGKVICYIHADGHDSDTCDFYVAGDELEMLGNHIPE